MPVAVVVFGLVFGALLGSFMNVVLHRVPRHESVVSPGSHCPHCNRSLRWYELVPIVSWLVLRGRCRTCGTSISARYPLVELACGIVGGLIAAALVV